MPFVNNLQWMACLLYGEDVHLLIKPDFIYKTAILRVNIGHIVCNSQDIQKLRIMMERCKNKVKQNRKVQVYLSIHLSLDIQESLC